MTRISFDERAAGRVQVSYRVIYLCGRVWIEISCMDKVFTIHFGAAAKQKRFVLAPMMDDASSGSNVAEGHSMQI